MGSTIFKLNPQGKVLDGVSILDTMNAFGPRPFQAWQVAFGCYAGTLIEIILRV